MLRSFFSSAIVSMVLAVTLVAQPPPRVVRPGPGLAAIERWSRMTPEQRRKALDRLPPERRQKIEEQLDRFQSLTPEQREQLRFRFQTFSQLPPEKREEARRLFRQFNQQPPDRQATLREEFRNLRGMSEADRLARLQSEEFRGRFNNREQNFLRDLSGLMQ